MANAIPVTRKGKAEEAPKVDVEAGLAGIPEHFHDAARAALAEGRQVSVTVKGFLKITE